MSQIKPKFTWLSVLNKDFNKLSKVLKSFFVGKNLKRVQNGIFNGIIAGHDDATIYNNVLKGVETVKDIEWEKKRALERGTLRNQIIKQNINIESLDRLTWMDYGAAEGDIAIETHKEFIKIKGENNVRGFAVDVKEWHGHSNLESIKGTKNLSAIKLSEQLLKFDEKYDLLPFVLSNSVDIIFIEMVLHHLDFKSRKRIYRTFHRILSKDGIIVVREHGPNNPVDEAFIHVQHAMYGVKEAETKGSTTPGTDFFNEYYAEYLSLGKWTSEWKNFDFSVNKVQGKYEYDISSIFGNASTFYSILKKNSINTQTVTVNPFLGNITEYISNVPLSFCWKYDVHEWTETRESIGKWIYRKTNILQNNMLQFVITDLQQYYPEMKTLNIVESDIYNNVTSELSKNFDDFEIKNAIASKLSSLQLIITWKMSPISVLISNFPSDHYNNILKLI